MGQLRRLVRTVAAPLALGGLVLGCRPPAVALAEPWGLADPCGSAAILDDAALGAALAYSAEGAAEDLDALAPLVAAHGGGPVELIEGEAASPDLVERAAAGLGRPACRWPVAGRVRIEVAPGARANRAPVFRHRGVRREDRRRPATPGRG